MPENERTGGRNVVNFACPPQVTHKGVVIAKINRGPDSNFILKEVYLGEVIERRIQTFAPLVKEIKVLHKAFIHKRDKRVRRSKLYYLRDRDPLICSVP